MNRKSKFTQSVTALYCRLSIEDGRENESMSISNQKALLRDFAEKMVCWIMSITLMTGTRAAISTVPLSSG